MAANTRLDDLHDLIRHKSNLQVTCATCDRVTVIDAQRLARYCLLRCWNTQLGHLTSRLLCGQCGGRPAHLRATHGAPGPDPFPKHEGGWKALFKRLRD